VPGETALDVAHLTVRYGAAVAVAVDGLDLSLHAGETGAMLRRLHAVAG
jgi:hypothetical protein